MKLIGTVTTKDDQHTHISAEADTYLAAKAALSRLIPETHRLTSIRVIREH